MQRIPNVDAATATGTAKELLTAIRTKLGKVPNMMKAMVHSPASLEADLSVGDILAKGVLTAQQQQQLAILVAQLNGCEYCLSAHTMLGKMAKLSDAELDAARRAESADPKSNAILKLAKAIVEGRGKVADEVIAAAREAGISDAEIVETVAQVAHNIFTNYFNMIAKTDLDFPRVAL